MIVAVNAFMGLGLSTYPEVFQQYAYVSSIFVALIALPSYFATANWLGQQRGWGVIAALSGFAFLIETFALYTGFPYGGFSYSDDLGWKILGKTPWTIFFAWTPFVLAAAVFSQRLSNNKWSFVPLNMIFLVIIDLVIDPAAVGLGYWSYDNPSFYYDVALMNYFGWMISGLIGSTIFYYFTEAELQNPVPPMLTFSAFLTFSLWSFALVGLQLWFPAILGILITLGFIGVLMKDDTGNELNNKSPDEITMN